MGAITPVSRSQLEKNVDGDDGGAGSEFAKGVVIGRSAGVVKTVTV